MNERHGGWGFWVKKLVGETPLHTEMHDVEVLPHQFGVVWMRIKM